MAKTTAMILNVNRNHWTPRSHASPLPTLAQIRGLMERLIAQDGCIQAWALTLNGDERRQARENQEMLDRSIARRQHALA
jgi:hypothetical protein